MLTQLEPHQPHWYWANASDTAETRATAAVRYQERFKTAAPDPILVSKTQLGIILAYPLPAAAPDPAPDAIAPAQLNLLEVQRDQ